MNEQANFLPLHERLPSFSRPTLLLPADLKDSLIGDARLDTFTKLVQEGSGLDVKSLRANTGGFDVSIHVMSFKYMMILCFRLMQTQ